MPDKTYTTTEISRICDVYPATVINWIDSGKLRAYVTPGGHRRVTREDLIEFLKRCQIPIPEELYTDKKTVLLVDDDPEMVKLMNRAFSKHKDLFSVQSLGDGVQALVQIGQRPPDLLVLDIIMPGMDGLQVCDKLREIPQTSSMKIVAISGKKISADDEDKHGIHASLKKPFPLEDLIKTAAKLLRIPLSETKNSVSN